MHILGEHTTKLVFGGGSAHTLRHTGCTRMAEQGLDMKVVQYIMGHANIGVTMEVYNHITERERIENEISKMDAVQVA